MDQPVDFDCLDGTFDRGKIEVMVTEPYKKQRFPLVL